MRLRWPGWILLAAIVSLEAVSAQSRIRLASDEYVGLGYRHADLGRRCDDLEHLLYV